jgi:peptidoglycan/xylan/chitin deacetylase (PgdA/CDA1 family)
MSCRTIVRLLLLALVLFPLFPAAAAAPAPVERSVAVPILLYHRFGATAADSMTMRTSVFESHLKYLKENGYTVIPLRKLVDWYQGKGPAPAPKSVVIVADDAHRSVYEEMAPLVKKYQVPVTLFVYPSAVSNAKYAMTWDQLRELEKTGLFDSQSHTYWHPNFKKERKKLSPAEFDKLAGSQLRKAKDKLEKELGKKIDLLAWPFGIYDEDLVARAAAAGYISTFTIERRHATAGEKLDRLPRYLLVDSDQVKTFAQILNGAGPKRNLAL